jgi:hypothetical protein
MVRRNDETEALCGEPCGCTISDDQTDIVLGSEYSTAFLRQRLPVDFPVSNVQVPRNEDRSHRLNTALGVMVEIAGDQLCGLQTIRQR